jgi:hypothetical protein
MECTVHTFVFPYVPWSPHMKAHEQSDIAKKKETLTSHSTIWLLSIRRAVGNSRSTTALPNHGAAFTRFPPQKAVPRRILNWYLMRYYNLSTGNYLQKLRRGFLTPSSGQYMTIRGNKISQKILILTNNGVETSNWQKKFLNDLTSWSTSRI